MKKNSKKFTVPNSFKKPKTVFDPSNSMVLPFPDGGKITVAPLSQNMNIAATRNQEVVGQDYLGNPLYNYSNQFDPSLKVGIEKFNILPSLGKKFVPLYGGVNVNVPYSDPSKAGVMGTVGFSGEGVGRHRTPVYGYGELQGGYSGDKGAEAGAKFGADIFLSRTPLNPKIYANDTYPRQTLVGKVSPHLRAGVTSGGNSNLTNNFTWAYGAQGELKYRFPKFPGVPYAKAFIDFDPAAGTENTKTQGNVGEVGNVEVLNEQNKSTLGFSPLVGGEIGMRFPINTYKNPAKEKAQAKAREFEEAEKARIRRELELKRYQQESQDGGGAGQIKTAKEMLAMQATPQLWWESLTGKAEGPAQEELSNVRGFTPTADFANGGYMAPILPSPMKNPDTPIFRDTTALPFAGGGMLKRTDGSYSKRGLWDNIRANAGSGKAPTKEMLKQEKKINKELAYGGSLEGGRKTNLPEDNFMKGGRNIYDSVYASSLGNYYTNGGNLHDSIINSNLDNYFTAMNKLTGGGNIHIKPENRGKFTASAKNAGMGVQAFAQKVLANKEDYSSTQVKRANFARNAAGWNHGVGGFLFAQGGQMNQLTEFNEGGLHEENPLGGIPQGVNQDGQVNLVEEGETKLNSQNYVFSDKLKVDAETAAQFNLPKSSIGKTFSEVSKKANRPSSRREGDDIEERAKIKDLDSLMQAQEAYKQRDAEQKIAELEALHPGALESLVGQQGGMPQGPEAMGQEQMPPMSEEEAMMMQQQMAMQGAPQSYGGSMYAFGGNMKNPEAAQKWATGLGMAAPFLNLIPGVGQVASLATGAAAKGLGMAANNAMTAQSEEEAMMQANRMGNDYGGAIPPMNPALGYAYGGPMTRQLVGGGYGLNSSQLANIGQYPTGLSDMQKRNIGMPMGLNYGQQQNVGISDFEDDADILTADVADNSTDSTGDIPDYMQYGTWKDAQTDLEGADETLGDNSGDYSVNQTPFQAALNLAPAVYNTATGIFGKVKQLNPEDYMVKSNVKAPLIDITPQERAAQQTYAAAQSGLTGAGPGAGAYMTNMQNLANMRNAALGEMYTKKANIDAANQFEADKFNTQLTASNADKRFAIEDYNNRAKAAKTAMLQEGLKQFAGYSDAQTQNQIAMQYGKMGSPDMSRIMKWGYTPYNPFKK